MKKTRITPWAWVLTLTFILTSVNQISSARTVTDMAGRAVELPEQINKIYCTSPVGAILLYTLAPEKLAGWNYSPTPEEKVFLLPEYHNLPALGGWFGKAGTGNLEEIAKAHPDLILSTGSIEPTAIALSERLQRQSSIPVVVIGSTLTELDQTYLYLGQLLGNKQRAQTLADYCRATIEDAVSKTRDLPASIRPRVYYAQGPKGLETDPSGSFHAELLDLLGAVNVAQVQVMDGFGRTPVSMEQLLAWNPQVIIAGWEQGRGPGGFLGQIQTQSTWSNLDAVKAGRVYETPQYPFNWFDRPPSVNRILGVKWVAHLLYPDLFTTDLKQEVIEFYELFYHIKITSQQADQLLERAIPTQTTSTQE